MNALLELFRHKTWASLGLIDFCQSLAPETLEATIPGTYGTVHATIQHFVDADAGTSAPSPVNVLTALSLTSSLSTNWRITAAGLDPAGKR